MGLTAHLSTVLLAHQGGWDEVLIVVAPLVAIWLVLMVAKKRANTAANANERAHRPAQQALDDK